MIQGKGYRKIVSSEEMRRIAEMQRLEHEAVRDVELHGSQSERRALRARNNGPGKVYWHPGM